MTVVRDFVEADRAAIVAIANELPEWFDEHARSTAIPTDIRHQTVVVATDGDDVVGFISLYVSDGRWNIGWIGVARARHRQGIGQKLVRKAEEKATAMGLSEIAVMTLGDSVDYPPYQATRSFYFKNGFEVFQRSRTDNPGCPEELRLLKRL
jgi:ribosomal protein S18 acetylase RimI-like enzyme